jgi:hypothetical protein
LDLNELMAALGEIERAAHDFVDAPANTAPEQHLLEVLRRRNGMLNEPYGFEPGTDALRSRVWTDCMTILSNLELAPQHAAGQQSDLVRTQVQKLSTLIEGLLELVRPLAEKR